MKKKANKATHLKPKTPKKKAVQKVIPAAQAVLLEPSLDDLSHLGRQPIEFYQERYGNRFRVIDNIGFVYSDGKWVAVDVDGFTYMERDICPGDPEFVAG